MSMTRLGHDASPSAAASMALAYQRLAEQDAERRAWLDAQCKTPDPSEERIPHNIQSDLEFKEHETNRCIVAGCSRNQRAKRMCDQHYRAWRRQGMSERELRRRVASAA